MKLAWILFISTLLLLLGYRIWEDRHIRHENLASDNPQNYTEISKNGGLSGKEKSPVFRSRRKDLVRQQSLNLPREVLADSITRYGLSLIGAPYLPAGITCDGFDCSGFIYHIYQRYGIELPHSSKLLIKEGEPVPLTQVQPGDLLIFTGTDKTDRTPGHVGVVISEPGLPVAFVHASSVGGVKVSQVAGTGYEQRFLEARRVLE